MCPCCIVPNATDLVKPQSIGDIRKEKQLSLEGGGGLGISFATDEPQYAFGVSRV